MERLEEIFAKRKFATRKLISEAMAPKVVLSLKDKTQTWTNWQLDLTFITTTIRFSWFIKIQSIKYKLVN